ncbi:MAG: hypothetical protein IT249_05935 [Chitinophagaceae bacterium]|nr:hypothetical protein [Chitinophagaceae bacterium]
MNKFLPNQDPLFKSKAKTPDNKGSPDSRKRKEYIKTSIMQEPQLLNITVDNIDYDVKVTPVMINNYKRLIININDAADHIYTWDEQAHSLKALDEEVSVIPKPLEKAISDRLKSGWCKTKMQ